MGIFQEIDTVEQRFFESDKENKFTTIFFQFDTVSKLFDPNYKTKQPVITDELLEKVKKTFTQIPKDHDLILDFQIKDSEGYTEEQIIEIFKDNILLEYKMNRKNFRRDNYLAFGLIGVGILAFILMLAIGTLLPDGGLAHDIFFYISDIAATVTIWEALYIILVESHENRFFKRIIIKHFHEVRVHIG